MKKKILIITLILTLIISPFFTNYTVEAKTLRDYYNELDALEAKREENEAQKAYTQEQIRANSENIANSRQVITDSQAGIEETRLKIQELNVEIENKKEEIKNLILFEQISSGDNVYLEYVFGASDFTDFIYRTAIVEQLSEHNETLIDQMYVLIDENKALAVELNDKIAAEQKAIEDFNTVIAQLQIEASELSDMYVDVEAEIKALEAEIQYLEDNGCELDESLSDCIDMPYADGFIRPLKSGSITSEYGWRYHPTLGYERLHAGIDIGVWEGSPVYPVAAGIVSNIVYYSSCGGNIVRIQHIVDGQKYTTVYMHLLEIHVGLGEIVTSNTQIGLSGGQSTSYLNGGYDDCTTGGHLHLEFHYGYDYSNGSSTDPRNFIYFPSSFYSRY